MLITIVSCASITLKCSFESDFVWRKYGCVVKELNSDSHITRITAVEGRHATSKSNDDVQNLRIENIATNNFFTNDFFVKFPQLQNLVIHDSSVKQLLRGDFTMAEHLVNIHITRSELTDLEDFVFHGTKVLKMLNLRQNKIRRIAENAFKGLMTLKYLTLSFNEIQSLHRNVFKDLGFLEQLSLSTNQIRHIDEFLFSKNRNLEVIFLDHNQLKTINGNMFVRNDRLREIYMDDNHIKHISNIPNFLVNLKSLEIAVFTNNTCVDSMVLIMNNFFPPYQRVFEKCKTAWKEN